MDRREENARESREAGRRETQNKLEELENIVEKRTRTERHMEQHSDIASPDQMRNALRIQHEREERIADLEDTIVYGDNVNNDEYRNLKDNFESSRDYLRANQDHMSDDQIENMKEKQENRRDQMRTMR